MGKVILVFNNSGWCAKLGKSYSKGRYEPKTDEEFQALKEFASEIIKLKPVNEASVNTELTDEDVSELRAKAKAAGIKNWHSKLPQNLIKELSENE